MTLITCADENCGATGSKVEDLNHVAPCTGRRLRGEKQDTPIGSMPFQFRAPELDLLNCERDAFGGYGGKHFRLYEDPFILAPTAEQQLAKEQA